MLDTIDAPTGNQRNRASPAGDMTFSSALPEGALVLQALKGEEAISSPFLFQLELAVTDGEIDVAGLLGEPALVTLSGSDGSERKIHGQVARVIRKGDAVSAELRPWLWFLNFSRDCRIFQQKSVPEIVEAVVNDLGFSDFRQDLVRSYPALEYCVQYRETALDFVRRLLEEAGIAFLFEHSDDADTLVLIDDPASHPDLGDVHYRPLAEGPGWHDESAVIDQAALANAVVTGTFEVEDYNFEVPSTDVSSEVGQSGFRVYEFPAGCSKKDEAEVIARDRLDAAATDTKRLQGGSALRSIVAGSKLTMDEHPQSELNDQWLITRAVHQAEPGHYRNQLEAVPASQTFRPPLRTPKPRIAGIQTAKVVGPDGKEIWTDTYGRIRVKFHWDQRDEVDENCSCWVRVAQIWAGKSWGGLVLPRIGQEVVVAFLEGDPDRPLVTGCVYNGENPVPYPLSDEQTKSVFKSQSSEGGDGYNELIFEDKAGEEEIAITAQKDFSLTVSNDRTTLIDQGDDKLDLSHGNRDVTLAEGNETLTVKGTRELNVDGAETHNNKADVTHNIDGTTTIKVGGDIVIEAGGSVSIKAGSSLSLEAGTEVSIKAGTDLSLDGGTNLSGKAGVGLTMEGATMEVKGSGMGTIDGGGMLTVKGGMVMIN